MSTMLMGLCWPLKMSPTLKSVLISLADQANDQGYCWPSIATMSERTCLSERAVRGAVRALEAMGLLHTDVGAMKSNRYILRVREFIAAEHAKEQLARVEEQSVANSPRHHVPPGTTCPPAPPAGEGGTTCPLTVIEPNTNTPHTPQPAVEGRLDPSSSNAELGSSGKRKGGESAPAELATWLAACKQRGEQPVPEGDAVFRYAETVGIDAGLLRLCWREFKRRYTASRGRQRDWRQKFRNCVEGNWYGLWYLPPGEPARLSSKGEQAQRYWAAADAQCADSSEGASQ